MPLFQERVLLPQGYGRNSLLSFVMSQNLATAGEKEILILYIWLCTN
jgi:hypothetical protein